MFDGGRFLGVVSEENWWVVKLRSVWRAGILNLGQGGSFI